MRVAELVGVGVGGGVIVIVFVLDSDAVLISLEDNVDDSTREEERVTEPDLDLEGVMLLEGDPEVEDDADVDFEEVLV